MNNAKKGRKRIECEKLEISLKKIGAIKETFHARMGMIKDRKLKDLTESEEIKKWEEYTEELYKKGLNNPENHNGVVTHLELAMLDCEVSRF